MSAKPSSPIVINGWTIYAHPLFLSKFEELAQQVEALKQKDPAGFKKKNATKRLAAIAKLAFIDIPQDPSSPAFRQGKTLGGKNTHWFRAKFFQQYRLFFRFDTQSKLIVYAWVNDEDTKRAYNSPTDAYGIFRNMLANGNPPNSWDILLAEARKEEKRFQKIAKKVDGED